MMDLLFDPLFRLPLLIGLCASIVLPLLGAFLHAREEWLAALGVAHVTAAAQLVGAALGWPLLASGALGAVIAVAAKQLSAQQGNLGYALMMLAGWSANKSGKYQGKDRQPNRRIYSHTGRSAALLTGLPRKINYCQYIHCLSRQPADDDPTQAADKPNTSRFPKKNR